MRLIDADELRDRSQSVSTSWEEVYVKNMKALYYALENAHYDVSRAGFVSSAMDRICFYMNYKDYCRLCGLLDQVICLDNGKRTFFGHEIKIRDELKHIYLGIEMDEEEEIHETD